VRQHCVRDRGAAAGDGEAHLLPARGSCRPYAAGPLSEPGGADPRSFTEGHSETGDFEETLDAKLLARTARAVGLDIARLQEVWRDEHEH